MHGGAQGRVDGGGRGRPARAADAGDLRVHDRRPHPARPGRVRARVGVGLRRRGVGGQAGVRPAQRHRGVHDRLGGGRVGGRRGSVGVGGAGGDHLHRVADGVVGEQRLAGQGRGHGGGVPIGRGHGARVEQEGLQGPGDGERGVEPSRGLPGLLAAGRARLVRAVGQRHHQVGGGRVSGGAGHGGGGRVARGHRRRPGLPHAAERVELGLGGGARRRRRRVGCGHHLRGGADERGPAGQGVAPGLGRGGGRQRLGC